MKVLFLTRFDFTESKKDGGLLGAYRNYELMEQIYGSENLKLCIISQVRKADCRNIKYFFCPNNIIHNYLTYFCLKDRIPNKLEQEIVNYINQNQPDLIFYDGSTYGQFANKLNPIKWQIVYFHNIERQYTWEQVKKHSWLCIFRYLATKYNERKMVEVTENLICVNERDAKLLKDYYGKKCNFILPATFSDTCRDHDFSTVERRVEQENNRLLLLFVGSYFSHNYKGLLWFIREVLPSIDCELTIVGKNMEKLEGALGKAIRDKVVLKGTVERLEPYYIAADAIVMPIFMGGGIKVKTAEAMMYGKTIFASTEALQGYEIEGTQNIYRCDTKESFIESINKYCRNESKKKFNAEIRQLFLDKYSTEAIKTQFEKYLYEEVMECQ